MIRNPRIPETPSGIRILDAPAVLWPYHKHRLFFGESSLPDSRTTHDAQTDGEKCHVQESSRYQVPGNQVLPC